MHSLIWLSTDFFLFFTWLFILILGLVYRVAGVFVNTQKILMFSVFYLFLLMLSVFYLPSIEGTLYFFNDNFMHNNFIKILKFILIFLVLVILIMCIVYLENEILPVVEFVVLILISLQGLFLIVDGNDLILTFLGIELQSLSFYILVGLRKNSNLGIEAAFKYFILSAYSNMISLFGISMLYGFFGTTKLNEMQMLLELGKCNNFLLVGILFFFVGIFFKLAIFMFHYWIGDVYQGSLLIVTAYFSIVPKIVYVFFFFKLYLIFSFLIKDICILLSLLSILYGTLISMYQTSIRRLLAYSSLTHIGYIILGISLNTIDGYVSSFFYIIFYILLLVFSFSFLLYYVEKHSTKETFYIDDLSAFSIMAKKNYFLTIMFSTILLSMAGVPFFAGFFSKFYIFLALYNNDNTFLLFLIMLISVVSAVYYIRLIRFLLFVENTDVKFNISFLNLVNEGILFRILICCFIINLILFFFHSYIYIFIINLYLISYA